MPKLNIGIKKEDLEKTGIKLKSDYSDVFSLIFIGELHLKNPVSGGLGVSKLTVINYGAYNKNFTCLVTEFLMSSFDGIKKFKNYKHFNYDIRNFSNLKKIFLKMYPPKVRKSILPLNKTTQTIKFIILKFLKPLFFEWRLN